MDNTGLSNRNTKRSKTCSGLNQSSQTTPIGRGALPHPLRRSRRVAASQIEEALQNGGNRKQLSDLPNEMLFKIFESLDMKSILNMREVGRRFKAVADDWVKGIDALSFSPFPTYLDGIKTFNRRELYRMEETHTVFTSLHNISDFMNEMHSVENPFPTRSVLLWFFETRLCCLTCVQKFELIFYRFIKEFGERIHSCFVIFSNTKYVTFNFSLLRALFNMKNLNSLSVYCDDWSSLQNNSVAGLPRFQNLKQLQIYGKNGAALLHNAFFRTGNTENLVRVRVSPNDIFRGRDDWFILGVLHDLDGIGITDLHSFHAILPKVKKLVLHDPCVSLIQHLGRSEETDSPSALEEFSVFFEQSHRCDPANLSLVGDVLRALYERHANSLKTLHFYIHPRHVGRLSRTKMTNHLTEIAGQVNFPNVKKISITYATAYSWPQLLIFLGNKCPNLEILEFQGLIRPFGLRNGQVNWLSRIRFDNYCRRTWVMMPKSLRTIAIPDLKLISIKPEL